MTCVDRSHHFKYYQSTLTSRCEKFQATATWSLSKKLASISPCFCSFPLDTSQGMMSFNNYLMILCRYQNPKRSKNYDNESDRSSSSTITNHPPVYESRSKTDPPNLHATPMHGRAACNLRSEVLPRSCSSAIYVHGTIAANRCYLQVQVRDGWIRAVNVRLGVT